MISYNNIGKEIRYHYLNVFETTAEVSMLPMYISVKNFIKKGRLNTGNQCKKEEKPTHGSKLKH